MGATILAWPGAGRTSPTPTRGSAHHPKGEPMDGGRDAAVAGMAADAEERLRQRRLRALRGLRAAVERGLVDMTDLLAELERSRARAAARLTRENIRAFRDQLELLDLLEAERPPHTSERP
jgi:hypothetical protein